MHTLKAQPKTDPTSIYRYRDGLFAADLLTAALAWLDLFTWLNDHPSDEAGICRAPEIKERPTDVTLTLFAAMGFLHEENGSLRMSHLARRHPVRDSPWLIGPCSAPQKE